MTEQEKFEEWANGHGLTTSMSNGVHSHAITDAAWVGWQARAALESKPGKSFTLCDECVERCKENGIQDCTGFNGKSKPETAIDRLRKYDKKIWEQETDIIDAILELDSRLSNAKVEFVDHVDHVDHAAIIKELLDFIGNDYKTWNTECCQRIAELRKEYGDE